MAELVKTMYESYQRYAEEHREKLIDDYFLMGSPLKILGLSALYWLFVTRVGQKWMEKRQAFDLKRAMLIYNLIQVAINFHIVQMSVNALITNPFYADWSCMRRTTPEVTTHELHGYYYYYIIKVLDYMDTIFMVLRKRNRQITFLHVYHHMLMAICVYLITRFNLGGHTMMLGLINGIIHMIMYAYYFVAALRPGMRNSLWWKKHITHLQIAQFLFLIVHFGRAILNENCDQSKGLMVFCIIQAMVMVGLFSDFYYKAYLRPSKKVKSVKAEN